MARLTDFPLKIFIIICIGLIIPSSYAQCGLDVFVANDQSGSVDAVENAQGRHFITKLMRDLDPWGTANNQSRMAIAQWDSTGSWQQFNFPVAGQNYTTQLSDVLAFQNSPRILNGGTDPYGALLKTYNAMNQTPVAGRTSNQVIILMTDATCDQIQGNIADLANLIKNEGVNIIVLAIDEAQGCTILQGDNVASPNGYFSAPNYADLEQRVILYVQSIIAQACSGAVQPGFDLTIQLNNFSASQCILGAGTYKIDYTVKNEGRAIFANNLLVSFYSGDPTLPGSRLLTVQNAGVRNIPVNGNISGSLTDNLLRGASKLYAIVNYNGNSTGNNPPVSYNLTNSVNVPGEQRTSNNFSNGVNRVNDSTCHPAAVLNVNVTSGGIGCDNRVNYQVEICNTGNANANITSINPIAPPGFALLSDTASAGSITTFERIWATYFGGSGTDKCNGIAMDDKGNIYIAGSSGSSGGVSTAGAQQTTYMGGGYDAFLAKFTSEGIRLWATYYGDLNFDSGVDLVIDHSGNVFLTGYALGSTANISTPGSHQPVAGGGYDAFLVKFDSSGVRQWGTYYGGSGSEYAHAIALDMSGNIYMGGHTDRGLNNISTPGAHQPAYGGGFTDAFLVKFNNNGVRQWATYYGGSSWDQGYNVVCDASNNVYLLGTTESVNNIITTGAYKTNVDSTDVFIVKFNSNGVRQWGTYYGGISYEYISDVITDNSGNLFFTGYTNSGNGIATAGAHQPSRGGGYDAYIAKFNTSGGRLWGTYLGGAAVDVGTKINVDAANNIYAVGNTKSTTNIASAGSYKPAFSNTLNDDAYIAKFNSSGVRQWGTYYGDWGAEDAGGILAVNNGVIYFTGETTSTINIATPGTHQPSNAGNFDVFLVKFQEKEVSIVLPPDSCIIRQYIYNATGVTPGTYNYSTGITAEKMNLNDGIPLVLPDSNFNAGTFTNIDGFNGAVHTSDNVTITGNTAACAPGDKVNVSVSIPTASGCGGGNYVQATVTINNTSGVTLFNPKLYLNLTGTGATFAGELYNLTNNLSIPAPNILASAYPNVANAMYGKAGIQSLPIYQLPAGTSTFNIDINLGSALTNLGVRVDSLPTIFNASGSSNLAVDAQGVTIPSLPAINGFSCPASIATGNTISFSGISVSNASTVKWASTTVANITNTGSLTNPSITYTPTPADLANGFVAVSLTALNSAGCDVTRSCQVAINNVVYDYGDAPITYDLNKNAVPYAGSSTLLSGIHLGTTAPTTEATTKNSADAKGDGVEEDGLPSGNCTSKPINLQAFPLIVKATNTSNTKAYISAFADWNNDGDYLDDGETVTRVGTVSANSGTQNYTLNFIPETANISLSQYFVRLRISSDSNSIKQPYESSPQGEIEDHVMKLGLSATYRQFVFDICQGDSVKVNNIAYKITGTYFDTLVNSVGCDSIITVKLTVNPTHNKTQKIVLCQGASIKVGVNTYTQTGIYTDSLKTTKNCDSVIVTNLTVRPKYALSQNVSICSGSSYTIGLHIYTQPGIYKDTLKTSLGCDSVVTTSLSYSTLITSSQNVTICPNGSYTIGTHTYTQAGTYKDTFQTSLSCDSVVTTTINVAALQTATRNVSICSNEQLVIGNNTYTTTGIYKDTIRGSVGCDTLLTTNLTVYPKPVVHLGPDLSACPDSAITLNAGNAGAGYQWSSGQLTQQIRVTAAGTYTVTVNKDNCSTKDTVILRHKPAYKVNLGTDVTLCNKDTLVLNVATTGGSYIWQDGSALSAYWVKEAGTYHVTVTTECTVSSDTINVEHEACDCLYYVPSAFSPNGDGINDAFGVVNQCEAVTDFKFEIFNRWGELIYQSGSEAVKWDGFYRGLAQQVDDYVYILSYIQNSKERYQKGIFSLLR